MNSFRYLMGELTAPPVLEPVYPAAPPGDHLAIALDHRGHLLALVGMYDEYDLVMSHSNGLLMG